MVGLFMALDAANRCRHESIAFAGVSGMLTARSVTFFTLHVCELRRRVQGLEPASLVANHVTPNTFVVELLALFLESSHRMRVPGRGPYFVLLLVTSRARFNSN